MSSHYLEILEWLREKFPPLTGTDVNHRTLAVWQSHWIDRETVQDIAARLGWSVAAVDWHLRRASRLIRGRDAAQDGSG
jgi:hypothetical protein